MPLPDVSEALFDLGNLLTFIVQTKTIVDYSLTEPATMPFFQTFQGVLQPIKPKELEISRLGELAWKRWSLWTPFILAVDQIIKDMDGRQFRVMHKTDWSESGYREYELQMKVNG